jgi:hypothetical protein
MIVGTGELALIIDDDHLSFTNVRHDVANVIR